MLQKQINLFHISLKDLFRQVKDDFPNYHYADLMTAPFVIESFSGTTASGYTITWSAEPGYSYQVRSSVTMEVNSWSDVGSPLAVSASENSLSYFDAAPLSGVRRFYRVTRSEN